MYRRQHLFIKICLIFVIIFPIFQSTLAQAHSGSVGYSDITIENNKLKYDLYLLADLVGGFLMIDKNQDGYMKGKELTQSKTDIEEFVVNHLEVKSSGQEGQLKVGEIVLTERWNYSMFHIELEYDFAQPINEYVIEYSIFFDGIDPNHQNFVTVHTEDSVTEQIINAVNPVLRGNTELSDGTSPTTTNETLRFADYLTMGMKHIWAGIDHLLFILALLLARTSLKDYLKILTAFTVGHCITLALAALEIIQIPGSIIEPLIALSIVYVAIENIRGKTFKWRWMIALVFGLVHGFGFAEILSGKLGSDFVIPLLSFNLGVEIGQVAVLLILIPFIIYLGKIRLYTQIVYSASTIISLFGLYWFFDRVI